MAQTWAGRLHIGAGWAIFKGRAGDNAPHRHFAAQFIWTELSVFTLTVENELTSDLSSAAIDPLQSHQLTASRGDVAILYIEPTIAPAQAANVAALHGAAGALARSPATGGRGFWDKVRQKLIVGEQDPTRIGARRGLSDDRIIATLRHMEERPVENHSALRVAHNVDLSLGRFLHLFRAQVGVPFRRYVLWRRLQDAVAAMSAGVNATQAAHAAGFSDSAHFARTLRDMFGVRASDSVLNLTITADRQASSRG